MTLRERLLDIAKCMNNANEDGESWSDSYIRTIHEAVTALERREMLTDREILERAVSVLLIRGCPATAIKLQEFANQALAIDPAPPPGKEVRIAVAIVQEPRRKMAGGEGPMIGAWSSDGYYDDAGALDQAREQAICRGGEITHMGWVTAIIPPVSIPTVEGTVQS